MSSVTVELVDAKGLCDMEFSARSLGTGLTVSGPAARFLTVNVRRMGGSAPRTKPRLWPLRLAGQRSPIKFLAQVSTSRTVRMTAVDSALTVGGTVLAKIIETTVDATNYAEGA
jgi:hypothetical protein